MLDGTPKERPGSSLKAESSMKKSILIPLILATVVGVTAIILLLPPRQKIEGGGPVAATIFPIYDIARELTAGVFDVTLVLLPGSEPHAFEPSPSMVRALADAKVVYAVGNGLDNWIDGVIPESAEKMTVDGGIALRASVEPFHDATAGEKEDDPGQTDPHYWLTVPNAKIIAATITVDLKTRFPVHAVRFEENAAEYAAKLDALDAEVRADLEKIENRAIISFHDAWYYFAAEYGLTIAGTFEPTPNREPTPRYLQELERAVKDSGVSTLYTEPLFSSDAIFAFAADNGLTLSQIDDIGGLPGRGSYIELMRYNAKTISTNQ